METGILLPLFLALPNAALVTLPLLLSVVDLLIPFYAQFIGYM